MAGAKEIMLIKNPLSPLFSYLALGDAGIRQRGGQILKVPAAGSHPGEGVGTSDEAVTAPRGAQDAAWLWNVGIPCGQRERWQIRTGQGSTGPIS